MPKVFTRIETSRPAPGVVVRVQHVEWVPERPKDEHSRLPSTWRQPIGKELTDRVIFQRALEGWYGVEWKNRALATQRIKAAKRLLLTPSGRVETCACGETQGVTYRRWSYLPKPGLYCRLCIARYQGERDKEANQRARWRELMKEEYQ